MKRLIAIIFLLAAVILLLAPPLLAQWEPDVRLTYSSTYPLNCANNAKYIASSRDTVHLVWAEGRSGRPKIFYKRSTDGGITWEPDTTLTNDSAAVYPPVLAASGKLVHVAWMDQRDGRLTQIYYKGSSDGGSTWGPDMRLSVDTVIAWNPCLAASGTEVHLVWHHTIGRDTTRVHPDIFYRRSTDGGRTWEAVVKLTTDTAYSVSPSATVSGTNVHVAWLDNRTGSWRIYYKRSTDRGITWGPDAALASAGDYTNLPSLAAYGSNIYIIWNRTYQLFYLRSTNDGESWEPERCLSILTTLRPSIEASGPNVHIVWHGHQNLYPKTPLACRVTYKRSTDRGTTWEPDTFLTADTLGIDYPSIAVSGVKVHIAWQDGRNGIKQMYYKRNLTGNSGTETAEVRGQRLEVRIKATPNPFTSFATIPRHEGEHFALYDIAGRKVGTYRGEPAGWSVLPQNIRKNFLAGENRESEIA